MPDPPIRIAVPGHAPGAAGRAAMRSLSCDPAMEGATEPIAAPPSELPEFRGPPPPRHGGLVTLLRFLRRHGMLNLKYGRVAVRLGLWKLRLGRRLLTDGLAFIGPG